MGLISGVGIQSETQLPAILCFLFICIPSAYYLSFVLHIGMQGIFFGQAIGQAVLVIFYFRICYNIDWEVQVEEIKLQNQKTETQRGSIMTNPQKFNFDEEKRSLLETGEDTILTGSGQCQSCTNRERRSHLSFQLPDDETDDIQLDQNIASL